MKLKYSGEVELDSITILDEEGKLFTFSKDDFDEDERDEAFKFDVGTYIAVTNPIKNKVIPSSIVFQIYKLKWIEGRNSSKERSLEWKRLSRSLSFGPLTMKKLEKFVQYFEASEVEEISYRIHRIKTIVDNKYYFDVIESN